MPEQSESLQFDRAEYSQGESPTTCTSCTQLLSGEYYRVNGSVVCPTCKERLSDFVSARPSTREIFRGLLWGLGGSALGLLLYYLVSLTGYQLSLVAIAVGFIVGKAVHMGANGRTGRRLQMIAVVLTYFSICGSLVPLMMTEIAQGKVKLDGGDAQSKTKAAAQQKPTPVRRAIGLTLGVVVLFAISLASPVLNGFDPIGWLILGIGLWEAWRINRRPVAVFDGPFGTPAVHATASTE